MRTRHQPTKRSGICNKDIIRGQKSRGFAPGGSWRLDTTPNKTNMVTWGLIIRHTCPDHSARSRDVPIPSPDRTRPAQHGHRVARGHGAPRTYTCINSTTLGPNPGPCAALWRLRRCRRARTHAGAAATVAAPMSRMRARMPAASAGATARVEVSASAERAAVSSQPRTG